MTPRCREMKIFIFWDIEAEEIWYYISDGLGEKPILVEPHIKKKEDQLEKEEDDSAIH